MLHPIALCLILMVSCVKGSDILILIQDKEILPIYQKLDQSNKTIVDIFKFEENVTQEAINAVCNLSRPKLILDMTTWRQPSENAKKIIKFAQIPTITTSFGGDGDFVEWSNLNNNHKRIFLQIKQPADLIPYVARAIIEKQRCSNAGIFYDNTIVMMHKMKMLLLNMDVRHTITEYTKTAVERLKNMDFNHFFVIGSKATISQALADACEMNYLLDKFVWYGITLEDNANIYVNCPNNTRYILAHPHPLKKHCKVNFDDITDNPLPKITMEFYYDIMKIALEAYPDLEKSHLPLVCSDGSVEDVNGKIIKTHVEKILKRSIGSGVFLCNEYYINGLWNSYVHVEMDIIGLVTNKTGEFVDHFASWSSVELNVLSFSSNINMYQPSKIYKIAIAIQEPFLYPEPNSTHGYIGFCIDLIEELSSNMNFKFELYRPKGSGFRYDFDAVLDDVRKGTADIALGPISATPRRQKRTIDFTIPFYDLVGMMIMVKIPESSKSIFKIIEVLDVGVWCMILALYFITSILIWVYDKYSPYSFRNNKEALKDSAEKREFTMRECLWFSLTSLTSQGGGEAPRPFSAKIVVGLWWFFGFLMIASYTAILAAFLTATQLEMSIESLDDLSKQYRVKYGVIRQSSGYELFQDLIQSEQEIARYYIKTIIHDHISEKNRRSTFDYPIENMYSKMWKFMVDIKSMPNSLEEAIAKVKASTSTNAFAYIGDATDIKFAVMTNCDLQAVGEEFIKNYYSLAVAYKSPLKESLDNELMHLLNERKLESMKNKWWRDNPKVVECSTQTDGITIQNIVGVILLIGGGVLVSMFISALENAYEKRKLKLTMSVQTNQNVPTVSNM